MEGVISIMTHNGALGDVFDEIAERWIQSFNFMEVFVGHALGASRYVRPAAE